ncbi:MAG: 2TM domain-containing protein [Myxococcales bacterium]|nr:MAG: 2TM domain-containing protein [Myxococcales bacterium]
MAEGRKYSDAEVKAILDRALSPSAASDGLSHTDLLSIGEQVGVPRDALARAAEELHDERQRAEAQRVLTSRRRRWLGYHAALFALVNALAFAVNFLTTPGEWWSLFSIVPWAFALILHAGLSSALPVSDAAIERQRQRAPKGRRSAAARLRVEPSATPPTAQSETEAEEAESPATATLSRRS